VNQKDPTCKACSMPMQQDGDHAFDDLSNPYCNYCHKNKEAIDFFKDAVEKKINAIRDKAVKEEWLYSQVFSALKELNMSSYDVEIEKNVHSYVVKGIQIVDHSHELKEPLKIASAFNAAMVKEAIKVHQKNKTSFIEFLKGIAEAGCWEYHVDMEERKIFYRGKNKKELHTETVP
jgi:uncharacterized protein YbcV (DUF1398 family)